MNILVSACLVGQNCRYDGENNTCAEVVALAEQGHSIIPVCPETMGGLPIPRTPAEVQPDGSVVNRDGEDVTLQYQLGTGICLEAARQFYCSAAILKERSPACGCRQRYDGTFTKTLMDGMGVTAQALSDEGLLVLGESEIHRLSEVTDDAELD